MTRRSLAHRVPAEVAVLSSSPRRVVALPVAAESGRVVSGDSEPDRFVMGLLRACADAVLVGAGTFRKGRGYLWHPDTAYPAGSFQESSMRPR